MEEYIVNIAKDFSPVLGGRWISLGQFSGEEFYNKILRQKFEDAKSTGVKLNIYLDGAKGYGSSFLDQSFGELARQFNADEVIKTLVFHTEYFEWVVKYINEEIWQKK
jgi:hypothetical protein